LWWIVQDAAYYLNTDCSLLFAMDLGELLKDVSGFEVAISSGAGLAAGVISGLFDKKKTTSGLDKTAISAASGYLPFNAAGTFGANVLEGMANMGAARLAYEIGYQATQRMFHKKYHESFYAK
jgi:hypothetical protein